MPPKPPSQAIHAHWLIRLVDKERRKAEMSTRELSMRLGMSPSWWVQISGFGKIRGLAAIESALDLFGYKLVAEKQKTKKGE